MKLGAALLLTFWITKCFAAQYLSSVFPDELLVEFIKRCDLTTIRKLLEVSKGMGALADSVKLRKYYRPFIGPNSKRYLNWNSILNLYPAMSDADMALFPSLPAARESGKIFAEFTDELTLSEATSVTVVLSLMKEDFISLLPYAFKKLPGMVFSSTVTTAASFRLIDDITLNLMNENKASITPEICKTIAAIRGRCRLLDFCINNIDDQAKQAFVNVPVRTFPDFSILGGYLIEEGRFSPYYLVDAIELMVEHGFDDSEIIDFLTISLEAVYAYIDLTEIKKLFVKSKHVPNALPLFHRFFKKMFENEPIQAAYMLLDNTALFSKPENHGTARHIAELATGIFFTENDTVIFFLTHENDPSVIANFWIPLFFETGHEGFANELISCFAQFSSHDNFTIQIINSNRNKIEQRILSDIANRRQSGELFDICNDEETKLWDDYFAEDTELMDVNKVEISGADAIDLDYWVCSDFSLNQKLFGFLLKYFLNSNASCYHIQRLTWKFFQTVNASTMLLILERFREHQNHPNFHILAEAMDKLVTALINFTRGTQNEAHFFHTLCNMINQKRNEPRNLFYDTLINKLYSSFSFNDIFESAVEFKDVFMISLLKDYADARTFGSFLRRLMNDYPSIFVKIVNSEQGKDYREYFLDNIPDHKTFEKLFVIGMEADVDFEFFRLLSTSKFFSYSIKNLVATRKDALDRLIEKHQNKDGIDIIVSHVVKSMITMNYSEGSLIAVLSHFGRPILHSFVPFQTVFASRDYSDNLLAAFLQIALEKSKIARLLLNAKRVFGIECSQSCLNTLRSFLQ